MKRVLTTCLTWVVAVAWLPAGALAGPAPAATTTTEVGEWQARLSAKVLEWAGQTDLDYGFSIGYWRDPSHPSSVIGPLNDGRGRAADPNAFATFPSQSSLDLGLRIFLDQMNAKNGSLEMVIEALEQTGDVKMLAEPTLVLKKADPAGAKKAGDGKTKDVGMSTVRTGSRIPFSHEQVAGFGGLAEVTLFQDTGVVLTVGFLDVAELDDLYAKMKVVADVSSLAGYVSVTPNHQVPQINSRHIENTVLIRNKTTLIGGVLKEDAKISSAQGPPILGRIPLIKHLVRSESSTRRTHEILFLMNVLLIPPGAI